MDDSLNQTARLLVSNGKGILAADESTGTIKKRFDAIHLESTEESRRVYRELLFSTAHIEAYISGVILFDETIRQAAQDGTLFPGMLERKGIVPGIKVDEGTIDLAGFPGEKITQGLDGLRERLARYHSLGARFAKWRAVITIGDDIPTQTCLISNAEVLARYAAVCQAEGLVPIVEPEVLMDGNHSLERCEEVTRTTLELVFDALYAHRVQLEGMLLKPNMVVPGKDAPAEQQLGTNMVAEATLRVLRETVPAAVPGIVFLSGGQTPEQACMHLNAMNVIGRHPWALSFSFGRALQDEALKAWKGQAAHQDQGQQQFYRRANLVSAAVQGRYSHELEMALAQ
jgi:fructose-bisphosphate aldolase, class I